MRLMLIFSSKYNELEHLQYVCEQIKDKDFAERVLYHQKWYIYKANRSKFYYYMISFLNILIPLIISLLHALDLNNQNIQLLLIILPLVVSFLGSVLILFRFFDIWTTSRKTATQINIFLDHYLDEQKMPLFESHKKKLHNEFETIINKESQEWEKTINKNNNQEKKNEVMT